MKNELSWVDLNFIKRETDRFLGAKINKIYQDAPDEFSFLLWKSGGDKTILRIKLPHAIWLDEERNATGDAPSSFCMFLRKRIEGSKIVSIDQVKDERILKFSLAGAEGFKLIIEFMGKGNIILADMDELVEGMHIQKSWLQRLLVKAEKYASPRPRKIEMDSTVSKYFASARSMGKKYAYEMCARMDLPPETPLTESLLKKADHALEEFLEEEMHPAIVMGETEVAEPFHLKTVQGERKEIDSFSQALKLCIPKDVPKEAKDHERLQRTIATQMKVAEDYDNEALELENSAQAIYTEYQTVKDILTLGNETRAKKIPLTTLIDKKKGSFKIVDASDKDRTLTVELE